MSEFVTNWSKPVPAPEPRAMEEGTRLDLPVSAPSGAPCIRAFVNHECNSRLGYRLAEGTWNVKATATLDVGVRPVFILAAGDRVIVHGAGPWVLLDTSLRIIATGYGYSGVLLLDPELKVFHALDVSYLLMALRLSDGTKERALPLTYGVDYDRTFIARVGRRMLATGVEMKLDLHTAGNPEYSIVEMQDPGEPMRLDDDGLVMTSRTHAALSRKTLNLLPALHAQKLVLATENRLFMTDLDLKITDAIEGDFVPTAISLDETGRIHLVVRSAGRLSLWVLDESGRRYGAVELPPDVRHVLSPPIIAHDHRVFLLARDRVMAISADGRLVWECRPGGEIAGATITADDQLLLAAGDTVGAFDLAGEYRVLHRFEGDTLRTPPILTERGELLVAGQQRVYCLQVS